MILSIIIIRFQNYILPYLKDRPQNLHRHPNGIIKEGFYQKDNEGFWRLDRKY